MVDQLDQIMRDHFRAIAAPEAVRSRLVALAVDRAQHRLRFRRFVWGGLVAAGLAVALMWWSMAPPQWAGPAEIATSVATYHQKRKDNTIVAARIEDIAQGLPRLDFALRLPQREDLPAWRVEGGRYCSLGGNIAAQLRLSDAIGAQHTLYVSRRAGAVADIESYSSEIDGVAVRIWSEGNLTFAWATTMR